MKQPTSVTVICWVIIAFGIETIIGLVSGIAETSVREMLTASGATAAFSTIIMFSVFYCAVTIALAGFMLAGQNWARIAFFSVGAVMFLFQFAGATLQVAAITITGLKLLAFALVLFRPVANQYFSGSVALPETSASPPGSAT